MVTSLHARSISRSIWKRWLNRPVAGRVRTTFEHACNLETPEGDIVAVVLPTIGDGPLNVVVAASADELALLEPGMIAHLADQRLRIGELEIALDSAEIWEPRPDWVRLRAQLAARKDRFRLLAILALQHVPQSSLLRLIARGATYTQPQSKGNRELEEVVFLSTWQAADALRAGWEGDKSQWQKGVTRLAGLGKGLTPAGDDFLIGVMLWLWHVHPTPGPLCQQIAEIAAPRTTALSAQFLQAAANGECNAPWHYLLSALANGTESQVKTAIHQVLAQGATSGADTLAGFLWMGQIESLVLDDFVVA